MRAVARRVRASAGSRPIVMAALCGAAMALAQPPVSWPFVLGLALPPLVWLLDSSPGVRAGFGIGWAAGAGFFAAGLFWIVEPFLVDAPRHGWMAPFALVLLAGGLALFWGGAFALARRFWGPGPGRVALLASAWTLAEVLRAHVFTGFPWALASYAWIETPVMQVASVVGPHGLSLLTLGAGLAMALGPRAALVAVLLVGLGWGWGALRLSLPVEPRPEPFVVRLVQPNAAQELKWRPDMQMEFYQRHLALSRAPADPAPDAVIWSETAVPFVLGYADDLQAESSAAAAPATLILGIQRLAASETEERWYNSLAVLRPDGQPSAIYDKHHLVPFGEYIPFAPLLARLGHSGLTTLTSRGFTPGPGPALVFVPDVPPFLPLICYEAIFPHRMQAPEGRPDWIVQVTNDAWFGTLAGPYQHLAQARARAIEQGLPLARAANTGVSAMIDSHGRIVAALPLGVQGYVDAELPPALTKTIYAQFGDLPSISIALAIFALTVSNFRSSVSSRTKE